MSNRNRTKRRMESPSGAGLRTLLERVAAGGLDVEGALGQLAHFPFEEMGHSTLDHHRELRTGFGEVIYCAGKTAAQVAEIAERLARHSDRVLGTRATVEQFKAARKKV